ncbi:aminoglycoside 3'-phosphotransferase [Microbacterium sp. STN6]|uniref:aminoglycoside 3'-phosphotransferase n=1 Tax=Microbacterium sp. STN6 TaxID=2995588 RepID=UPI0022609E70|nr:aminoglycoside 3'-phosphotransferase [Microbacterium sp. STN6]MCX7522071.1 aminoglycoside 3'-phosphotransferase [Microbacterium sp. STN6]
MTWDIAAVPAESAAVPDRVTALSNGDEIRPVWRNVLGGMTYRLGADTPRDRHVKWVPAGTPELDLEAEAERLAWVQPFASVPHVIDAGADETGSWLVTTTLPLRSAVDPRWIADPRTAVTAIGEGLRRFHDTVPIERCPFTWSVEERMRRVDERIASGEQSAKWAPEHRALSVHDARAILAAPPPLDAVVCHGDACAPNTLLDDWGAFAAHVDLGSLGVADRWADLAVAAWSTEWNYGPGWEDLLISAYGAGRDDERIAYYRLLWDLS